MTSSLDAVLWSEEFPCEQLKVQRVHGVERIGQLFELDLQLVGRDLASAVDVSVIAGSSARLTFGATGRTVHGYIASAEEDADEQAARPVYRLKLVPDAYRLTLGRTNQIFMGLSVPEVIRAKLAQHGLEGYGEMRLMGDYPAREFIVQYAETDLELVSRLAEHAGISFHFVEVEEGPEGPGHARMVFSDHQGGFELIEAPAEWSARSASKGVHRLKQTATATPRVFVVRDYNYRTPAVDLAGATELEDGTRGGVVEYGAHVKTPDEAEALAKIRAEEASAARVTFEGAGVIEGFAAGKRVTLAGHPRYGEQVLLLTEVTHDLALPVWDEAATSANQRYENTFRATPAGVTYRPPRITKRPRIHGVVTGIVQPGPGGTLGGTAILDDHGRYVVQFHFDAATSDGASSRPIRMAQPFAGYDEGFHFPLKPGTEVLVAFVDGDPDRPLIVGALPNPETPSPVTAANRDANRIKTASGVLIEFGRGSG